jgi:hypothetical protein
MIVYVESNFVLEVVFQQEEAEAARHLIEMAQARKIQLAIPVSSLLEPLWTINRRASDQQTVATQLNRLREDLQRSDSQRELADSLGSLGGAIRRLNQDHLYPYSTLAGELVHFASLIGITSGVFQSSLDLEERLGLGLFDATVLASILHDLPNQPSDSLKILTSWDRKDFASPLMHSELERYDCRHIPSFTDALRLIESHSPS